jgi:hypothetical protein
MKPFDGIKHAADALHIGISASASDMAHVKYVGTALKTYDSVYSKFNRSENSPENALCTLAKHQRKRKTAQNRR